MRELPSQLRRAWLSLICALPLGGLAAPALSQTVPASLRACAAQSDPGRRLDCYDRAMKRLAAPPAHARKAEEPVPAVKEAAPASHQASAHADLAASHKAGASHAAAPASEAVRSSERQSAAPRRPSAWEKIFGGGSASRVTAHIVRLDRWPDAMVLHLDNGQVWRQTGRASGDLSLRTGESVTIEKHLGSYWLSSRHVSDMRVRPETR